MKPFYIKIYDSKNNKSFILEYNEYYHYNKMLIKLKYSKKLKILAYGKNYI